MSRDLIVHPDAHRILEEQKRQQEQERQREKERQQRGPKVLYLPHLGDDAYWRRDADYCWRSTHKLVIERDIEQQFPDLTSAQVGKMMRALRQQFFIPKTLGRPPFLLPGPPLYDETTPVLPLPKVIRCKSGDFDAATGRISPPDPFFVTPFVCQVEFDPCAEAPIFQAFVDRLFPDPGQQNFVLEFLGNGLVAEYNKFKNF